MLKEIMPAGGWHAVYVDLESELLQLVARPLAAWGLDHNGNLVGVRAFESTWVAEDDVDFVCYAPTGGSYTFDDETVAQARYIREINARKGEPLVTDVLREMERANA